MSELESHVDSSTIVAEATPPGFGGIAVVRVSGPLVPFIMQTLFTRQLLPRVAEYLPFRDASDEIIDMGIALYFQRPHSFTGEEVLELHGHGGPVVVEMLIKRILAEGARLARPGEFSERAFLNNKMDLTQAEAILDLIHASSQEAARLAVRSLQGDFAKVINEKSARLHELRVYIEAAIDFSDEEIAFLGLSLITAKLQQLITDSKTLLATAKQGQLLREGVRLVISGKPNVGKSSLLNTLCAREVAIVTPLPGTTRDVIREHILIDGMPIQLIDTAGLRSSEDEIEQEGIRRAHLEIQQADILLHVIDATNFDGVEAEDFMQIQHDLPRLTVYNKADLLSNEQQYLIPNNENTVLISAKTGSGISTLKQLLKDKAGFKSSTEGLFLARLRHIQAIQLATEHMQTAMSLLQSRNYFELIAEELRLAQLALGEITGVVTSNDLLGSIFKSFCIGK